MTKDDFLKCPFCDGALVWGSDSMASEVSDEYADGDIAVLSFYKCSRCGRSYEIMMPNESDRLGDYRDFWCK